MPQERSKLDDDASREELANGRAWARLAGLRNDSGTRRRHRNETFRQTRRATMLLLLPRLEALRGAASAAGGAATANATSRARRRPRRLSCYSRADVRAAREREALRAPPCADEQRGCRRRASQCNASAAARSACRLSCGVCAAPARDETAHVRWLEMFRGYERWRLCQ